MIQGCCLIVSFLYLLISTYIENKHFGFKIIVECGADINLLNVPDLLKIYQLFKHQQFLTTLTLFIIPLCFDLVHLRTSYDPTMIYSLCVIIYSCMHHTFTITLYDVKSVDVYYLTELQKCRKFDLEVNGFVREVDVNEIQSRFSDWLPLYDS